MHADVHMLKSSCEGPSEALGSCCLYFVIQLGCHLTRKVLLLLSRPVSPTCAVLGLTVQLLKLGIVPLLKVSFCSVFVRLLLFFIVCFKTASLWSFWLALNTASSAILCHKGVVLYNHSTVIKVNGLMSKICWLTYQVLPTVLMICAIRVTFSITFLI